MTPLFLCECFGWVGNVLLAGGSIGIAYRWRPSFILLGLGNIAYCSVGYLTELGSLLGVSLFMLGVDIFGYCKWSSNEDSR